MIKTSNSQSVITLRDIQVQYRVDRPLVLHIDTLDIFQGERVALIGPSGAGKTTLLRLLNSYIKPVTGKINILGHELNFRKNRESWPRVARSRVGFVFQDFSLIERATVFENVLWGRLGRVHPLWSLLGWFPVSDKQAAMSAIDEVNLNQQAGQRIDTLSGGQQQRVGVARVLAQEAEILLADEPISNLDPTLAEDVLELLNKVSIAHGATLIMSLHQPDLAGKFADRVIGLREGRIIHDQPAENLDNSAIEKIYSRERSGLGEASHE